MPAQTATLTLIRTEDRTRSQLIASPRLETFSLDFAAPEGLLLGQGTYSFSHPRLGEFAMFIVPSTRREGGQVYEAIFNRLV